MAQRLKKQFTQPVDTMANDALCLLETRGGQQGCDARLRQAWVTFLRSLLVRMPSDIAALKRKFVQEWVKVTGDQEAEYQRARQPHHRPTAPEFFANTPASC